MKFGIVSAILALSLLLAGCNISRTSTAVGASDAAPFSSQARVGSGPGNGGGAIIRNGSLLTLAQAGVTIPVVEVQDMSVKVPEISIVEDLIEHLALTDNLRGKLQGDLLPNGDRKYFNIQSADLSPLKRGKLLAEYYSAIGEQVPPGEQFTLVAITIGSETYLLPEFYELSDSIARAAILFHEALWVKNAKLPLKTVIAAEIAVENLLRSPEAKENLIFDPELFQVLSDALEDPQLIVSGAIRKDLEHGSFTLNIPTAQGVMPKVFHDSVISASDLLGPTTIEEYTKKPILDRLLLGAYWYLLIQKNPSLHFLKELNQRIDSFDLYFLMAWGIDGVNDMSYPEHLGDIYSATFDLGNSDRHNLTPGWVTDPTNWHSNNGLNMPKQYWSRFGIDANGNYPSDYSWVTGFYSDPDKFLITLKPYWKQ